MDPFAEVLRERGQEHERQYVESLRATRTDRRRSLGRGRSASAHDRSDARRVGRHRPGLPEERRWLGYADILQRIEVPSGLGRLVLRDLRHQARATDQGRHDSPARRLLRPARRSAGSTSRTLPRRHARPYESAAAIPPGRLRSLLSTDPLGTGRAGRSRRACERAQLPIPSQSSTAKCAIGSSIVKLTGARTITCGYVAGISRVHRRELQSQGIMTLSELAQMPVPLTFKPSRGSRRGIRAVAGSGATAGL